MAIALNSQQPVAEEKPAPTKHFAKVDYSRFADTVERLGIAAPELCEKLGYSRSSHNSWEKTGEMPQVASLACEALVRRAGKAQQTRIILRANDVKVLDGDVRATEIHPGIWVIEP